MVTALVAMYLFSALGVQGPPNDSLWHFGAVGLITIGVAVLIEMFSFVTGSTRGEITSGATAEENVTSTQAAIEGQRVSLARFGDDMVGAGMI